MRELGALLGQNSYPGRGILLGRTPDGKSAVAAYFIMGRSENSRNRIFAEEPDGIRTEAHDASKMTDPSLIIYHPVRERENLLIVTNGDQTDTIRDFVAAGKSAGEALRTRTFEPDAPNYTPRISGVLNQDDGAYMLSILKADDGESPGCLRFFYEYESPKSSAGHLIHTYAGDGNPLPAFFGEPVEVAVGQDIDRLTDELWQGLNEDNKVSLFVRYINLEDKSTETRIVNKHEG